MQQFWHFTQELAYTLYQMLAFLKTEVHSHPVQVYLATQDWDYHHRDLLLLYMGQMDLVPEFEDPHPPSWHLLGIGHIPADIPHSANWEHVIHIALEPPEPQLNTKIQTMSEMDNCHNIWEASPWNCCFCWHITDHQQSWSGWSGRVDGWAVKT